MSELLRGGVPRVSVVIPVYNKSRFLQECLDSVFAQTFTDLEVVAVDDKSTDDSLAILQRQQDVRLRVVPLETNVGPAGAAQRAMDLARGEYIVRMDADDIMYPDRIALQVAFMERHTDVGASGGQVVLFGDEEEIWPYPLSKEECRAQLIFGVPVAQGGSILRTSVLREHNVRYQDHWPRIGEDWFFWSELAKFTEFANIAKPVIRYRRGEQNISHGKDLAHLRKGRVELILKEMGLDPTEREVELHLLAKRSFLRTPDRQTIKEYRSWLDKLMAWNDRTGRFPSREFKIRVEQAWDELFHKLPFLSAGAALEHIRLSDPFSLDRLIYLLKCRIRRVIGGRNSKKAAAA